MKTFSRLQHVLQHQYIYDTPISSDNDLPVGLRFSSIRVDYQLQLKINLRSASEVVYFIICSSFSKLVQHTDIKNGPKRCPNCISTLNIWGMTQKPLLQTICTLRKTLIDTDRQILPVMQLSQCDYRMQGVGQPYQNKRLQVVCVSVLEVPLCSNTAACVAGQRRAVMSGAPSAHHRSDRQHPPDSSGGQGWDTAFCHRSSIYAQACPRILMCWCECVCVPRPEEGTLSVPSHTRH